MRFILPQTVTDVPDRMSPNDCPPGPKGAWNINFVERFSKPFTRIGKPGYKTRSHFSSPPNAASPQFEISNLKSQIELYSDKVAHGAQK